MTSIKVVQFSRLPHPPCPATSIEIWTSNLKRNPPLSPDDNQSLKESIIQWWPLYVIRSFLQAVEFRFYYQLIDLLCLSFDFFSLSWSQPRTQSNFKELKTSFSPSSYSEKIHWGQGWPIVSLCTFSWLYILVCTVVQKYHEMFF